MFLLAKNEINSKTRALYFKITKCTYAQIRRQDIFCHLKRRISHMRAKSRKLFPSGLNFFDECAVYICISGYKIVRKNGLINVKN